MKFAIVLLEASISPKGINRVLEIKARMAIYILVTAIRVQKSNMAETALTMKTVRFTIFFLSSHLIRRKGRNHQVAENVGAHPASQSSENRDTSSHNHLPLRCREGSGSVPHAFRVQVKCVLAGCGNRLRKLGPRAGRQGQSWCRSTH